jgi:hypothetical protein
MRCKGDCAWRKEPHKEERIRKSEYRMKKQIELGSFANDHELSN